MSGRPRSRRPRRDGIVIPDMDTHVPEARWQRRVETLGQFYGWVPWHAPAGGKDGRVDREQTGKGFPDLALRRWADDRGDSYVLGSDRCHCGGALKPNDTGVIPLVRCDRCRRDVPATAMTPPPACEIVFAELKAPPKTGDREKWLARHHPAEQREWLAALTAAGIEAHLWCLPDDYDAMHARLAQGRVRVEPLWSPLLQEAA